MGAWEVLVIAIISVFVFGLPILILYIGFRVVKRIFRRIDQLQGDLESVKEELRQMEQTNLSSPT